MSDQWKIVLAEQPLNFGPIDNVLFQKDTCHSFLALQDPEGNIVSEIHGLAHNQQQNTLEYTGGLSTIFNATASSFGLSDVFKRATEFVNQDHKFERLRTVVTDGEWRFDDVPEGNAQTVFEGSHEEVMSKWVNGTAVGHEFNKLDVFYTPFSARDGGVNSNSVAGLMLDTMGIDVPEGDFKLRPLGYENKLSAQYPDLQNVTSTHMGYTSAELDAELKQNIYNEHSMFHLVNNGNAPAPPSQDTPVIAAAGPAFAA